MNDDEAWNSITDSEQVTFLLAQLPKKIGQISVKLSETLLNEGEKSQAVVDAENQKKDIEDKIAQEHEKRKEIKTELEDLYHDLDGIKSKTNAIDDEIYVVEPKVKAMDRELEKLEEEL